MRIHSLKASFKIFISFIILLSLISALAYYYAFLKKTADKKQHRIIRLEKDFSEVKFREAESLKSHMRSKKLDRLYEDLLSISVQLGLKDEHILLTQCQQLFEELYTAHEDEERKLERVRHLLPELAESIRYIHQHHIGYLKNLLRHGLTTQDWDDSGEFQRSPVKSASEIDIISAAVGIQSRLLDIFSIFYKLQTNESPSALKKAFHRAITDFYTEVNRFEDYSLDAQDGILVEELLMNGRAFEDAFTKLLADEEKIKKLNLQLNQKSVELFKRFESARNDIAKSNETLDNRLFVLQFASIVSLCLLVLVILLYGKRIFQAFRRTIHETEKIQSDLGYQITPTDSDYEEFRFVFKALNQMAVTINHQIKDLEDARRDLAQRVRERTAELEEANLKLKKEIQDRIKAEEKRIELETRLNRAAKMEAIGMLAGGVAHDLNNILSGIVSYPDLLLTKMPKDSPYRRRLNVIKRSGERATAVVQDLLTMARRGVATSEVVNLNEIIEGYLQSPELKNMEEGYPKIKLSVELDTELLNIMGSPVHLSKTLMNLVNNAFEAVPEQGEIRVRTANKYLDLPLPAYDHIETGDYVVVTVSDDGLGMSDQDHKRIFEPFYTKKVMGRSGTGLGMAVVWATVKDHHGYIDIASVQGRGTTIYLYFPVTRQKATKSDKIRLENIRGNGELVLVVDDMEEQIEIASNLLEELNYRVKGVSSGEEAVSYLNDHKADILLLDMIMEKGIDGLETYRLATERHPGQKAVIASGYAETDRVKLALEMGVGAYIRKPYTIEKLGMAIKAELSPTNGASKKGKLLLGKET